MPNMGGTGMMGYGVAPLMAPVMALDPAYMMAHPQMTVPGSASVPSEQAIGAHVTSNPTNAMQGPLVFLMPGV